MGEAIPGIEKTLLRILVPVLQILTLTLIQIQPGLHDSWIAFPVNFIQSFLTLSSLDRCTT
jgi:hypothetical protein